MCRNIIKHHNNPRTECQGDRECREDTKCLRDTAPHGIHSSVYTTLIRHLTVLTTSWPSKNRHILLVTLSSLVRCSYSRKAVLWSQKNMIWHVCYVGAVPPPKKTRKQSFFANRQYVYIKGNINIVSVEGHVQRCDPQPNPISQHKMRLEHSQPPSNERHEYISQLVVVSRASNLCFA